jgi:hypothetical protein
MKERLLRIVQKTTQNPGSFPRIVVRKAHDSVHITIDGWDVGSINGKDCACSSHNLQLAEDYLSGF